VYFNSDLDFVKRFPYAISIDFGRELQNSQGTYLGVVGLGLGIPLDTDLAFGIDLDFKLNYGYHFLRTGNWSLGIEASAILKGISDYSVGEIEGKIGLDTRLKISKSFDLGLQIGVRRIANNWLSSEQSEQIVGYADVGLRYYF